MIRDLEAALAVGQPWPPESEKDRLQRYEENEHLFDGEHTKVFRALLDLFSSQTAEYNKIILILNLHRRISTLWADFLFGEIPRAIGDEDPESKKQKYLSAFIDRTEYWKLQHARQIDVSRFGHGFIEGYMEDGVVKLQVVHPGRYFGVVDEYGRTKEHVVAWLEDLGYVDHIQQRKLRVRIHRPGQIETREYVVSASGYIMGGGEAPTIEETGVDQPLIFEVRNLHTSSGKLIDDYKDLDSIVKRMEARLTRIGRILDVHSEPMFYANEDSGAFIKTESGAWVFDGKRKAFAVEEGKAAPGYVTWDGQLSGAFAEIDALIRQLYIISETCAACFEPAELGAQISGTALRLMLFVPLKKVDRLKLAVDPIIRAELQTFTAFEAARGSTGAEKLESIGIQWQDGLPEDFKETVANVVLLKSQGLIWDEQALRMLYHLEGASLQDALEMLQTQNASEMFLPGS